MQLHGDDRTAGHHDGTIGQRVRADGRDHQHVEVRRDDGAAAGQRVGSGAGGARDHQAVAAVGVHIGAVDPGFEIEHAAGFPLLQHHVVERQRARGRAVGADERASSSARSSRSQRPSSAASTEASMSCGSTSVRKPSRPRLMPISGTPRCATSRAAYSSVPSPPMAMTRSACSAISLFRNARRRGPRVHRAGRTPAISARTPRFLRCGRRVSADSATRASLNRPISAQACAGRAMLLCSTGHTGGQCTESH